MSTLSQADANTLTGALSLTQPDPKAGSPSGAAQAGSGQTVSGQGGATQGGGTGLRPSVLQLSIRDKAALYSAYMSHIARGGLFVPTPRAARLGDDVFAIVSLPDDPAKLPIPGKVCWITPSGVPGRPQGIGIQFAANDAGEQARLRIEKILGSALSSDRPTSTL